MLSDLPIDIKAETLLNYLPKDSRQIKVTGSHKRDAYEDIASVSLDDNGTINLLVSRNGIYDILPETLFHPIDRFENIPANEYKERVREEIEQQQLEEENARKFFGIFDNIILELSSTVQQVKDSYSNNDVIADIIGDTLPEKYLLNRFIKRTRQFLPESRRIRGDKTLLTNMLRYVLSEEGLSLNPVETKQLLFDINPRYNSCLELTTSDDSSVFLGNEYEENITIFDIKYWNKDECSENFLAFNSAIEVYEQFINDFFIGIESKLKFNVSTTDDPVRLSDQTHYNYLEYNTNL